MRSSRVEKIEYKQKVCNKTGKCTICPWHDKENYRRRPRSDKHKNHRD